MLSSILRLAVTSRDFIFHVSFCQEISFERGIKPAYCYKVCV